MSKQVELDSDFLQQLRCQKKNHYSKLIEFICQEKNCKDRLVCSVCLLQEHHQHFSNITLIETFFDTKQQNGNIIIYPELISESKAIIDNKEKFIQDMDFQLRENYRKAENKLLEIQQFLNQACSSIKQKLLQSQQAYFQKYKDCFKEINNQLENMISQKNKILINNKQELCNYLQNYLENETALESPNRSLQQSLIKFQQIKQLQVSLDNDKFQLLQDQLISLTQQGNFLISEYFQESDDFIQHRCMISQNESHLDYSKLVCSRVLQTDHKQPIYKILLIDYETKIVTASEDHTICVWNTTSGHLLQTMRGHTDRIWNLIELKCGRLASGSSDFTVRIWNLKTFTCDQILKGHTGMVCTIMAFNNGVMSGSQDKTIKLWDIDKNKCLQTLADPEQGKIMCLIMLNDIEICCGSDKKKLMYSLHGHTGLLRFLILHNNLDTLLSSSDDWSIRMWSLQSRHCLRVFKGHKHSANYLMIFKNDIFLSLSDDSYIKFWNLNDDLYLHTLAGHSSWVLSAIIMKDGTLLTTGADKTIKFWTEQQ